jgi:hypothetical protein
MMANIDQRLNGLNPLSYLGVDAVQPTNVTIESRNPLTSDYRNVQIGSWWLNSTNNDLFYLASLSNNIAIWINITSPISGVQTLTANSGGPVFPLAGNINIIGDGTTIDVVGDPLTNTLTVSAIESSSIISLTGNSGGPIMPTLQNINLIGSGIISVSGDIATSTLTINQSTSVATSFITQAGTAVPSMGVLSIDGSNGLSTMGSGNTVTIISGDSIAQSFITTPSTGTAIPVAGELTFEAGSNTVITASGSTITISPSGSGSGVPSYSTGTFVPAMSVAGSVIGFSYSSQMGIYTQIGTLVYVQINIALTALPGTIGNLFITNLPFTVTNAVSSHQDSNQLNILSPVDGSLFGSGLPYYFYARFIPSTTTAQLLYGISISPSPESGGNVITSNFLNTTSYTVVGCYFM